MNKAPESEQQLCVECGFCCDNTLFDIAGIKPGEKVPPRFKELEETKDQNHFFKLPCPFFDKKCTVYDEKKPLVCSSFRCKILKETTDHKLNVQDAFLIIKDIKKERNQLIHDFHAEVGEIKTFRQLLWTLRHYAWKKKLSPTLELIYHRAQLLEVHLVANFRSNEIFENEFETLDEDD